jgi:hypothetical protein
VNDQECAIVAALARVGISITPRERPEGGWGWSIQNDKIVRDWQGPYCTPAEASSAALAWLVEYARKGLLCHHIHPPAIDDDPLAPWLRAFPEGINI